MHFMLEYFTREGIGLILLVPGKARSSRLSVKVRCTHITRFWDPGYREQNEKWVLL